MPKLRSAAIDAVGVTGAVCAFYGLHSAYAPAAWVALGAGLLALWLKADRP